MNDLERYVYRRFNKHKHRKGFKEIREEVLANLQARIDDEMSAGQSYQSALDNAARSLGDVDLLFEGHQKVPLSSLRLEMMQIAVLYTLIPWVITIPFRIFHSGVLANTALTLLLLVVGLLYIVTLFLQDNGKSTRIMNVRRLERVVKTTWILWIVYLVLSTSFTLGGRFASNFWFHRTVELSGPYMVADLASAVLLPFASIFIPLYLRRIHRLIEAKEVYE